MDTWERNIDLLHVRNTNEVGRMKVVDYKSKGAINKRIYVEIGESNE